MEKYCCKVFSNGREAKKFSKLCNGVLKRPTRANPNWMVFFSANGLVELWG